MDKNILFLEIDGVLCADVTRNRLDIDGKNLFKYSAIQALNDITEHYDYHFVMISKWNQLFLNSGLYEDFLRSRAIRVNTVEIGDYTNKANYVRDYLQIHPCSNYLIIDPEPREYYAITFLQDLFEYRRILATDRNRCLDEYDAKRVIDWKLND